MAPPSAASRPGRALAVLAGLTALLYVLIFFVAPDRVGDRTLSIGEKFSPRLALDLEGGTQIDLIPQVAKGQQGQITEENIDTAIEIIRERVDGSGVAEAEVTKQGTGTNQTILISIPGEQPESILEQVQQTAELRFRQVIAVAVSTPSPPAATPTPSGSPSATPGATPRATGTPRGTARSAPTPTGTARSAPSPTGTARSAPSPTNDSRAVPQALAAGSTPRPSPSPAATSTLAATTPAPTTPATPPATQPGAQITPALQALFQQLDCSDPPEREGIDDPAQPLVTCGTDDGLKYILGPARLVGTDVDTAAAELETTSQGATTGRWQVRLEFTGTGTRKFSQVTTQITSLAQPENQLAIVLDGRVVSAPTIQEAITGGSAQITGDFTQREATDLANVLKYGALPLSFEAGSAREVSPTLGADSLRGGLLAGALGMLLVLFYMLGYYRGLGLVSAASLAIAGILSWGLVTLLGWQISYRLSLAGIAGLIVSIGITADSFVVFFERLRDEVREGKTARVAVESGWRRARRTIIVSDVVSLMAAVVLFLLSTASVRGFAFTLGLTTLVDIVVVFLFTRPLVTLAVRSKAWGHGRWSGLDPGRLGAPGPASPSLAMARARERRTAAQPAVGRAGRGPSAGRSGEEV